MNNFIQYEVGDIMSNAPTTIYTYNTFSDVVDIFKKNDISEIAVVDESGIFIGIITETDILKAFAGVKRVKWPHYDTILLQQVSHMMKREFYAFTPKTPLFEVLTRMIETGRKSFPIIQDDRVIGTVSRKDVIETIYQSSYGRMPNHAIKPGVAKKFTAPNIVSH